MILSQRLKQLYIATLLIGTAGFLLVLSLAEPVIINTADFSMYNSGWNGCSDLAVETYKLGKLVPLLTYNTSTLTPVQGSFISYTCNPENTTIISIGPRETFSDADAQYIDWFLTNGGIVFLADDFGTANSLLDKLNTTTRFSNKLLLDLSFEKNASFVTIYTFPETNNSMTENISSILANYPSSLVVSKNAEVLSYSSQFSWLDSTVNGKHDDMEMQGPFPIFSVEDYGKGKLIVCSTPSVFINSMKPYLDNSLFIEQILSSITLQRPAVIIDEAHRDVAVPFTMAITFLHTVDDSLKISIVLLVVIVYVLLFTSIPKQSIQYLMNHLPIPQRENQSPELLSLVDRIIANHPEWDREALERIIQRMKDV